MKQQLDKTGVLYHSLSRGRIKLLIIFVLLFVMFLCYTVSIMPYLEKRAFGAVPVDESNFAVSGTVEVTKEYKADKAIAKIYGYALKEQSYWENDKYFFSVKLDELTSSGLAYTASGAILNPDTDVETDPVAVKVDFINIGGVKTAVLSMGDAVVKKDMTVDGILTEISPLILENLSGVLPEGEMISKYMLDIRGIDMGSEFSDILFWFLYIALLLFLGIKLVIYYINPLKHPTYKQLEKYGETAMVIQDIETQFKARAEKTAKDETRTADWIMTKKSFYHKVEKNFTAKGSFKYTPYEK